MRKTFTPLMIFGLIWSVIVLLSWFAFPDWAQIPGGFLTLAGLTAIGVIAFLKDGYSFIKEFIESGHLIDSDSQQIENHDLFTDDDSQITNIRWNERDPKLISKYMDLCCAVDPKFAEKKTEPNFLQYCISMGLARNVSGNTFLTQTGVLLFCKKQAFPHTKYHIDVTFKDNEHDLSKEFSAPILESYFSILELLTPLTVEWRDPSTREKSGQESIFFFYPQTAIIEALVNFFIHRDYKKDDIGYITIYPDRIEFENPGQSLYPIDELINAIHPLKPKYKRNPRLVQAFRKTGLNQREGRGIIRIKHELEKNGSVGADGSIALRIENDIPNDRFRLIIYKKTLPAAQTQREQLAGAVQTPVIAIQAPISLHQLPPAPADFTGREKELEQILSDIENSKGAVISGLTGMGGIGKTALGLVVAHRLSEKYSDAQIFLDVRGTSTPLSAQDIMRHVILSFEPTFDLHALDDAGMSATYQSILHGKKAILFFDNVSSAQQITTLLPPNSCAMIITSRSVFRIPGLQSLRLDVLNVNDATQFLLALCPRLGDKALDLAKLSGFLPLALRIAGSFLEVNQDWPVEKYLAQLYDRKKRLSTLQSSQKEVVLTGEPDLFATFELSYQQLSHDEQLYWRILGVFNASFTLNAAAYVCELEESDIRRLLSTLQRYSLINFDSYSSRYSIHELLSDFASDLALHNTVVNRLYDAHIRHAKYYLQVLKLANQLYLQGGDGVLSGLGVFDRDWENIRLGQDWTAQQSTKAKEAAEICAAYPNAGAYCLNLRLYPAQRITWLEASLEANQNLGNRKGEGVSLGNLGNAHAALGNLRKATQYYENALAIDHEIGDRVGEGADLHNLGLAYASLGDYQKAIEYYEQALTIDREVGEQRGEEAAIGNLGNAYAALGNLHKANELYEQALVIAREIGDRREEGNALGSLGLTHIDLGNVRKAIEFFEQALVIYREIGDRRGEGKALGNLGLSYSALGNVSKAIEFYEQSLIIARKIGDRGSEGISLGNLGLAYSDIADANKANEFYEQALIIAREIGDIRAEGNVLGNLGLAYFAQKDIHKAIEHFERALAIHSEIGDRRGEGNAFGNLGLAYLAQNDVRKAIEFFKQALETDREIGDRGGEGLALVNLGKAFMTLGDIDNAISCTKEAVTILESIESPYAVQARNQLVRLQEETLKEGQSKSASIQEFLHEAIQAARSHSSQAALYFDVVTKMASDSRSPAEIQELGKVLQKILIGFKAPDLSKLPEELAKLVKEELEK